MWRGIFVERFDSKRRLRHGCRAARKIWTPENKGFSCKLDKQNQACYVSSSFQECPAPSFRLKISNERRCHCPKLVTFLGGVKVRQYRSEPIVRGETFAREGQQENIMRERTSRIARKDDFGFEFCCLIKQFKDEN